MTRVTAAGVQHRIAADGRKRRGWRRRQLHRISACQQLEPQSDAPGPGLRLYAHVLRFDGVGEGVLLAPGMLQRSVKEFGVASGVGDVAVADVVRAEEDEEAGDALLFDGIAAEFQAEDPLGRPQVHLDVLLPTATAIQSNSNELLM